MLSSVQLIKNVISKYTRQKWVKQHTLIYPSTADLLTDVTFGNKPNTFRTMVGASNSQIQLLLIVIYAAKSCFFSSGDAINSHWQAQHIILNPFYTHMHNMYQTPPKHGDGTTHIISALTAIPRTKN